MIRERRRSTPIYTNWDTVPVVMSIGELCIVAGLSYPTVLKRLQNGEIPGRKINGQWRIDKEAFRRYIRGGDDVDKAD